MNSRSRSTFPASPTAKQSRSCPMVFERLVLIQAAPAEMNRKPTNSPNKPSLLRPTGRFDHVKHHVLFDRRENELSG